jgi:hypothetical protein
MFQLSRPFELAAGFSFVMKSFGHGWRNWKTETSVMPT